MVSPLLRIHNETTFSMVLRFRRPQQVETEFASVLLQAGDTIDDSIAAFDSINLSGALKKALLSLNVGMCCNLNFNYPNMNWDGCQVAHFWRFDVLGCVGDIHKPPHALPPSSSLLLPISLSLFFLIFYFTL